AYLLGLPRDGIYEAMEVLTIARLANAIGAVGVARKAYLEAYYFAQRRESFGKKLIEHPLIQKDLLEMEIEIEANLIFLMKAIESFNRSWQSRPPYDEKYFYTRLLGHIVKNMTADMSARVTQLAMELHGGNGFMEDFPVARWHREALVTPIWEGGSNIQALDMLEVMIKKQAHLILFDELQKILEQHPDNVSTPVVKAELDNIRSEVDKMLKMSQPEVQYFVKELLNKLGKLTTAVFLINADEFTLQQANDNRFHILNNLYQKKYIRNVALDLSDIQRGLPIIDIQKELIPESI
ncbi:MAG: DNA alkylation response protein, partial [Methanobacteriota archaeon]